MLALGAVAAALVLQQRLTEAVPAMTALRDAGPFRATVTVNGTPQLGAAVQALRRGEAFGWAGSLCAAPDTALLIEARLIRAASGELVLSRARDLPPDARGCASDAWDIVLPPDLPPGRYSLQRTLILTPPAGAPVPRALPPLAVTVLP